MGPTFTTEIGRMRTQEAIARAEHYRLAKMAQRSPSEAEQPLVAQRRRHFFSWKRLIGVASAALMLSVMFASAAVAVPTGGGGGGGAGYVVPPASPAPAPATDPTLLIAVVATLVVAAAAATWIAWSERRTPKLA